MAGTAHLTAAATLSLALAALDLAWLDADLAPQVIGAAGAGVPAATAPPRPEPAPATDADADDAGLAAAPADAARPLSIPTAGCDAADAWDLVRHIYFERGSAELSGEAIRRIDAVARRAAAHQATLLVEGHADRRGTRRLNDELSAERAAAVAGRARAAGVDDSHLVIHHFGERRPIAPATAASRWRNRRVSLCLSDGSVSP